MLCSAGLTCTGIPPGGRLDKDFRMKKLVLACTLGWLLHMPSAYADDGVRAEVATLAASGSATLKGRIQGEQTVRYVLRAPVAGQYAVELTPSNRSAYFNISQAGKDEALYIGSINGNRYAGRLPEAGEYTITVYLMRNAARRNAAASYTLRIVHTR